MKNVMSLILALCVSFSAFAGTEFMCRSQKRDNSFDNGPDSYIVLSLSKRTVSASRDVWGMSGETNAVQIFRNGPYTIARGHNKNGDEMTFILPAQAMSSAQFPANLRLHILTDDAPFNTSVALVCRSL